MPVTRIFPIFFLFSIFFSVPVIAQNGFKDRDDALLYVARTMKAAATVSYEGGAQLKYQYAMYVEDQRMVYVTATKYDTTYAIIPYEAIDFADTGNLPGRYLNLYTAFGAFSRLSKQANQWSTVNNAGILMQDTAVYNTRRLMLAFDQLGKTKAADTVKQSFNNPEFFRLRPYQQLPRYRFTDSTGKEMPVTDVIKKASKPAIVFTWAEWCPPCVKLFDSLVQNNVHKEYSLILIKKGPKENLGGRYSIPKNFRWWPQVIFLFDNGSFTDTLDNGSVPLVFWTDANGAVIREHSGFNVSVGNIKQILGAIKQQKLKPGPRYYSYFDTPVVTEAEARFTYNIERKGDLVRLYIYFRKLERFELKGTIDYKINAIGELQQVH